jgi:hypothetical protein
MHCGLVSAQVIFAAGFFVLHHNSLGRRRHPYGQIFLAKCGTEEDRLRSSNAMLPLAKLDNDSRSVEPTASMAECTSEPNVAHAAEDDESNLLHRSGPTGPVAAADVVHNSDLTLKQRLILITGLLKGPLLASAVAVAGNFGITLALFPGVLTEMRSSNRSLDDWQAHYHRVSEQACNLTLSAGSSLC